MLVGRYPQELQPEIRHGWSECTGYSLQLFPVTEKVQHNQTPVGVGTLSGKFYWDKFVTILVKTIIPCNKDNPIMS